MSLSLCSRRHVEMTPYFSTKKMMMLLSSEVVKVSIILATLCLLQRNTVTGLQTSSHIFQNHSRHGPHLRRSISSSSSNWGDQTTPHNQPFEYDTQEMDAYDPVEAYHQLRRQYLTSTSRIDRVHYGVPSWDPGAGAGVRTRHNHNHAHSGGSYGVPQHYPRDNNGAGNNGGLILNQHRCYVCLPPNKGSREAQDILSMFKGEEQKKIADCSEFSTPNAKLYEFNCPPLFGGCILRIHGANVSRSCSKYRLNDCKKANSVEFCYCTTSLCNDIKPQPAPPEYEDDDEDGLGQGSGDGYSPNRKRKDKDEDEDKPLDPLKSQVEGVTSSPSDPETDTAALSKSESDLNLVNSTDNSSFSAGSPNGPLLFGNGKRFTLILSVFVSISLLHFIFSPAFLCSPASSHKCQSQKSNLRICDMAVGRRR